MDTGTRWRHCGDSFCTFLAKAIEETSIFKSLALMVKRCGGQIFVAEQGWEKLKFLVGTLKTTYTALSFQG
jgi:hypothetical protein